MSSTFLNIRQIKSEATFRRRLIHNLRKSNLKSGPAYNQEYRNIISIDNRVNLKKYLELNEKPDITKSKLSKIIAKLTYKIKHTKKETTKEKLKNQIEALKEQRDNTKALSNSPGQNLFFELDMSITSIKDKRLLRNKEFANNFLEVYNQWLKNNLPNAKIIGLAAHLDQSNPHAHVNIVYVGDNSITADLDNSFGKSPHYLKMQHDFNIFVREHALLKKYNLKLKTINQEGKKDYIPAAKYKLLQIRAKKQAISAVNAYVDKLNLEHRKLFGFDKDKIIEKLQIALINQNTKSIELSNVAKFFQGLEQENEKLIQNNQELKEHNSLLLQEYNQNKKQENNQLQDKNIKIENLEKSIALLKTENNHYKSLDANNKQREKNILDIDI